MEIKMKLRGLFASTLLALSMAIPTQGFALTNALFLSMDGSGSINAAEYTIQIDGYVSALQTVFDSNGGVLFGDTAIGVNIFGRDVVPLPWTMSVINDQTDLDALKAALSASDPGRNGVDRSSTRIDLAIDDAVSQITGNALFNSATNRVVDVSTDGVSAGDPRASALAAVGLGINVNCLRIGNNSNCNFVTQPFPIGNEFVATTFGDFERALEEKLRFELGVPEPSIVALLGLGLVAMGFVRRRKS